MMREISGLIYNATEEQVVRARNQLKASILFQQDGPGGLSPSVPFKAVQTSFETSNSADLLAHCKVVELASSMSTASDAVTSQSSGFDINAERDLITFVSASNCETASLLL